MEWKWSLIALSTQKFSELLWISVSCSSFCKRVYHNVLNVRRFELKFIILVKCVLTCLIVFIPQSSQPSLFDLYLSFSCFVKPHFLNYERDNDKWNFEWFLFASEFLLFLIFLFLKTLKACNSFERTVSFFFFVSLSDNKISGDYSMSCNGGVIFPFSIDRAFWVVFNSATKTMLACRFHKFVTDNVIARVFKNHPSVD